MLSLPRLSQSTIEHTVSSRDGDAYHATTADVVNTLSISGSETIKMLYLENTSDVLDLVIEKITGSVTVAGVVLVYTRNSEVGTIGAHNSHVPKNANYSSGKVAPVTCYTWDETGSVGLTGITGGGRIATRILSTGPYFDNIDGFMVLKLGNSLLITLVNGADADVEAEFGVRFYFDRPEV